ncbi:benzoate/H(+) symporter BenE family transporter [Arthrobacter ginkgonis]|uniref:Benzoate/H(+) symporter BenE family transporter n=1 Tax=Arthrobacter ginkgonis TaxID=1630594 RepID=A0ABP7D1V1_9MICC
MTQTPSTAAAAPPRRPQLSDVSLSAVTAGLVAVAVSYAGPLLVVLGAAGAAGLTPAQTASWVWAISVGSGIVCIALSLLTRMPVVVAWSVPGAALLITALADHSYSDAIGAYIVAAVLGLLLGATGWFGRLLAVVPRPILAAVLAGVLLPFVLKVAGAVVASPLVAGGLVAAYLLGRRFVPKYAVLLALLSGIALAAASGQVSLPPLTLEFSAALWTVPTFSLQAVMGISVPLLIVTMAGQNGPGLAMMHTSGYEPNDRLLLGTSAAASLAFAPLGAHSINLAAITAGICAGREAHQDPARRYVAGVSCGVFFILFGVFAGPIVALLGAVPEALVTATAGVALVGALQGAFTDALAPGRREPAVVEAAVATLMVTASGVAPFGIVAPFWGIAAGSLVYLLLRQTTAARRRTGGAG